MAEIFPAIRAAAEMAEIFAAIRVAAEMAEIFAGFQVYQFPSLQVFDQLGGGKSS